ncbi:MAG: hypothetical protein PHX78_12460 [bacterium]|nr:hypothetical protein [bacterium]
MKKMAICLIMIFILSPRYYAKEAFGSKEAEKIKIEPAQPLTVNIKLPHKKYFKVKSAKFEFDNIKQDLSGQYILVMGNNKGDSELSEEVQSKTWAVQEIVSESTFELSKVEIKMGVPREDNLELLVCDSNLYEKARGIIKYDESKKECYAILDPTSQVQKDEHIFLAVKLVETPINVKTGTEDRLSAFYTNYPDGFQARDPFPEYLKQELAKSKKSLIYKLYSTEAMDIQPSFQVKISEGYNALWTWNGEDKVLLKDKNVLESINMYFSENRANLDERDDVILPIVFTPEGSTYPIILQLASWEMEIKIPEDYFMELKSAINEIFKNDEKKKTDFSEQLQAIWDSYKAEAVDDVKEKIKSFVQDVSLEEEQARTKGDANEIKGMLDLTDELKSIFEK